MYLHHVVIHVRNLSHIIEFLGAFGFACVHQTHDDAWVQTPNAYLHLVVDARITASDHPFTDRGISHICIQTPDMRHAIQLLHHHGLRPLSLPVNLGTGHWYVYARLPDGDIIEIEGVPYAPTGTQPWLAHVALVSTDVARIADFYRLLTATTLRGGHTIGPNPRFDTGLQLTAAQMIPCWLVGLNLTIECWQFLNPPSQAHPGTAYAYREIGLVSTDPHTMYLHAVAHGATLVARTDTTVCMHDPDGNRVTLTHVNALPPFLRTYTDPTIIARINAHWQPLDPQHTWEATHG